MSKYINYVVFLAPVGLAIAVMWYINNGRVTDAASQLDQHITRYCAQTLTPDTTAPKETDFVTIRLNGYLSDRARNEYCDVPLGSVEAMQCNRFENIRERIKRLANYSMGYISILSMLPFLLLAVGLGRRNSLNLLDVWRGTGMRLVSASIVATGFTYVFYPFGQGSSAVLMFLKDVDIVSTDTIPLPFQIIKSDMKHLLMAFLGWYVHFVGLSVERSRVGDVLSASMHRVLFRKYLVVIAAAMALSAVAPDASLVVAFLLGVFPLQAIGVLKELSQKRFDSANAEIDSLTMIPDTTRATITRLDEEGIDTIAALAFADPHALSHAIPEAILPKQQLLDWIDMARLIAILGHEKWQQLRWTARTMSEFIEKCRASPMDPTFATALANAKIENAADIAAALERRHPIPSTSRIEPNTKPKPS